MVGLLPPYEKKMSNTGPMPGEGGMGGLGIDRAKSK